MENKYKVVTDSYAGYEVRVKFWWFPLKWFQCCDVGWTNTHDSLDIAKEFIEKKKTPSRVVYED